MTIPSAVDAPRCRRCRAGAGAFHRLWCPVTLRRNWLWVLSFSVAGVAGAFAAMYATGLRIRLSVPLPWVMAAASTFALVVLLITLGVVVRIRTVQRERYESTTAQLISIRRHLDAHDSQVNTLTQRIDLGVRRHYDHQAEHNEQWTGLHGRRR